MKLLDAKTSADLVKLLVFIVVTTLATGLLVVMVGNLTFGASKPYKAEFVDATGVVKGDDVRVAGVKVGSVTDIEIIDRPRALVSFDVDSDVSVNLATHAAIRYRNLVGQRYISLSQQVGDTTPLEEDAVIDVRNTSPALDLTVLFNGFKPLFQALSPDDINQLSFEIVQVFQGEGGTLESLLGHTASVTKTLADRDEVITDLIVNLDDVLDRIADRDSELSCAASPTTSTATRVSSTVRCRCFRSSWRRWAAPRSTAPTSTSTSATSRAASACPAAARSRSTTTWVERGVTSDEALP